MARTYRCLKTAAAFLLNPDKIDSLNRLTDQIKKFLSNSSVTIAILLLAIAGRIIQLIFFFNFRLDASHQVIATKNFLRGNGISMDKVFAEDLASTVYEPLINWPPAYSLLLAPFYAVFGNYLAAGLALSIAAGIGLIFISRSILKLLSIPVYLVNLWTLAAGFFIYFFYFIACSDAIAIFFALVGIYFCLSLIKSSVHTQFKTIGIIAPLLICGAMKYLFTPVIFIVPGYLLLKGFAEKRNQYIRPGIISMLSLIVILGSMLLWQKSISGTAAYISEPGRGFFPDHLLAFFPFVPGSFIKPDTIALAFQTTAPQGSVTLLFFQLIHLAVFLILTWIMIRFLIAKSIKGISLQHDFFTLSLLFSWGTTLLLAVLSLQVEKETWESGQLWTYIEEQRYYGLPIVMIQLCAIIFYQHYKQFLSKWIKRLYLLLLLFFTTEIARGVVFTLNRVVHFGKEEYSWQYEYRLQQYADGIIKKALLRAPAEKIVVAGPRNYINHRVCLYSNAPILQLRNTIPEFDSLKASEKTLLIIILESKDSISWSSFIAAANNEVAGHFNGLYFYTVYVNPQ